MDEIASFTRRCRATNRDGSQCGNPPAFFQEVCRMHGAGTAHAKAKAEEFKLRGRDIACGVLLDAMNAEPCEACGRTRDMPVAVRAAIAVLDRTGMGPQAVLTVHHRPDDRLAGLPTEELIAEVEILLNDLRELHAKEEQRHTQPSVIDIESVYTPLRLDEGQVSSLRVVPDGERTEELIKPYLPTT